MASVPEFAPFLRRQRLRPTPKVRPFAKIKWDKLLAEATAKDFELNEKEYNYEDETEELYEETGDDGVENSEGLQEERPLNLCNKSHTMPTPGNPFPNCQEVLDLSARKKKPESKSERKSLDSKKLSPCSISNSSPILKNVCLEPLPIVNNNTENNEKIVENKENVNSENNSRNIFSTPIKKNVNIPEKNIKQSHDNEIIKSCIKNDKVNSLKQNLIFLSEKKQAVKSILNDKSVNEEEKKKKLDFSNNKSKIEVHDKVNAKVITPINSKKKPAVTTSSTKFVVPSAPASSKEPSKVLVINKKSYQILAPLGKGGSSKVYLVINTENELLAIKCVRLSDVSESTKNDYLNEIQHLLKMQHSKHVIKLYDHQYLSSQKLLFVVMERGETDLSRFLKDRAASTEGISSELIMYYWTEMLLTVKSIHDNNIIHRDLKPANFLLVSGRLKLIDFGIASSIQTEQTSIFMESQSGTFNYMSPEALQDLGLDNKVVLKIGRKTDVWSLGCILYYFLYKKTPYQDIIKPLLKLKSITDPNYVVPFPKIDGIPDILIESCKRCLIHDTKQRASIEELLALRNRPLFSLSQILGRLEKVLPQEHYKKAAKAFEGNDDGSDD